MIIYIYVDKFFQPSREYTTFDTFIPVYITHKNMVLPMLNDRKYSIEYIIPRYIISLHKKHQSIIKK